MVDISKTNNKINKTVFKDMLKRYNAYKKLNPDDKDFDVFTKKNLKGDIIKSSVFSKMVTRWTAWKKNNNGKEPSYVYVNVPLIKVSAPKDTSGWVLTGIFREDYQDTSFTCGPSSAQMVFSALGYTFNEEKIAELAGTNSNGTTHNRLYSAMKKLVPTLEIKEYYLSSIGFDGISRLLKNNYEIILHIQTYPSLKKDANGNSVWVHNYGHYIYLVGVNPLTRKVRVADPTKGIREFTYSQIINAVNAVSGQKSVMTFHR